jgi:hypothetical protein
VELPVVVTFVLSQLLAQIEYNNSRCLFNRIACVTAGRGFRYYSDCKIFKEKLLNHLNAEVVANMLHLIIITLDEFTLLTWTNPESYFLAEFLKCVNAPQSVLTNIGLKLLPRLNWISGEFIGTAEAFLGGDISGAMSEMVLLKIKNIKRYTDRLDILVFLNCCSDLNFLSSTEILVLKDLVRRSLIGKINA